MKVLVGRLCYALLWPVFFLFMVTIGAIEGAFEFGKVWIKWTPEIWNEMS